MGIAACGAQEISLDLDPKKTGSSGLFLAPSVFGSQPEADDVSGEFPDLPRFGFDDPQFGFDFSKFGLDDPQFGFDFSEFGFGAPSAEAASDEFSNLGLGTDLGSRLTNGPTKAYGAVIHSTVKAVESEHDSLRASLITLEKMRDYVAAALKRVYKLGGDSKFQVIDCATLFSQYMGRDDFECPCMKLRFVIVP